MRATHAAHVSRRAGVIACTIVCALIGACQSSEAAKKADAPDEVSQTPAVSASTPDSASAARTVKGEKQKLVVYYFHTTYRCHSCNLIEKLTKTAIESGFAEQLDNGRVEFRSVNIETDGNKHFVQDYKLYTKSVVLSYMHHGEQQRWKNLEKVWTLLRSEEKFIDYIQREVSALL
jgi:hypothetical protein